MKEQYYFGRALATEIDYFAFPRSGSHFFRYCTQGLYDLAALRTPGTAKPEAINRQSELEPLALYALDLREDGAAYSPVVFHTRASGQHGLPVKREHKAIVLIRDPLATVYSFYLVARDRWNMLTPSVDHGTWVQAQLRAWHEFYAAAAALSEQHAGEVLIIRFEALVAGPEELERVAAFIDVPTKLRPHFVHHITRFENFIRPGERTFYRAGDDDSWRNDQAFCKLLDGVAMVETSALGYELPPLNTAR